MEIIPLSQVRVKNQEVCAYLPFPPQCFSALVYLKYHTNTGYKILSCISGVDYPCRQSRLEVVYEVLSIKYNQRLRLRTLFQPKTFRFLGLDSVTNIYMGANWWEREVWDMFGILFENHPSLRRILTDYGFQGHPLRKDFPLTGYEELRYDDSVKRVVGNFIQNL